jgi:ADP-ribosyl-[dinitrogen reductase] hydrolase
MIGGIIGDFIGSEFEHMTLKTYNLLSLTSVRSTITDESVMLAATADALLNDKDFAACYMAWGHHYDWVEYGPSTEFWLEQKDINYIHESYGNGAAGRAGVIGMLDCPLHELLEFAHESARCSHNHLEAINATKAVVYCVWAIRQGKCKQEIYEYLLSEFGYLMFYDIEQLKRTLTFDTQAENSVPPAIFLALESNSWIDCIRLCLYCAGAADTDTIMSIAGLIAQQRFPVCHKYEKETKRWLFKNAQPILQILQEFEANRRFCKLPF